MLNVLQVIKVLILIIMKDKKIDVVDYVEVDRNLCLELSLFKISLKLLKFLFSSSNSLGSVVLFDMCSMFKLLN